MGPEHGKETWSKSGRGGSKTNIGSRVSTELFYCFLPCSTIDCSGGSHKERRIFRQAQAQEKCVKPGGGEERVPSTTPEGVFIEVYGVTS